MVMVVMMVPVGQLVAALLREVVSVLMQTFEDRVGIRPRAAAQRLDVRLTCLEGLLHLRLPSAAFLLARR